MKPSKIKFFFFLYVATNLVYAQYGEINIDEYIQNAGMFEENQLPMLPTLIPFENFEAALYKNRR